MLKSKNVRMCMYVCMYVCVCMYVRAACSAVGMEEVQHVPTTNPRTHGRTVCVRTAPLLPASCYCEHLIGRKLGPCSRDRVAASDGPGCRVQSAGCRMQTVQRSIVSDGRFDRLEVPEWAASQGVGGTNKSAR